MRTPRTAPRPAHHIPHTHAAAPHPPTHRPHGAPHGVVRAGGRYRQARHPQTSHPQRRHSRHYSPQSQSRRSQSRQDHRQQGQSRQGRCRQEHHRWNRGRQGHRPCLETTPAASSSHGWHGMVVEGTGIAAASTRSPTAAALCSMSCAIWWHRRCGTARRSTHHKAAGCPPAPTRGWRWCRPWRPGNRCRPGPCGHRHR